VSIFHDLTAKPWVAAQATVENLHDRATARKLALRVFLAVVTVLFMLLVVAYGRRMAYEDWRPSPQLDLLWANTFALMLSSVALQWAQFSVRRGHLDGMRVALLAGGAFTVVFLVGQILAWRQLAAMVYFDVTNPAIAFFYLITGCICWAVWWPGAELSPECGAILTWRKSGTAWSCVRFTGTSCLGFGWSFLVCCFQGIIWIFC
jgi:cytochrome c oxidase subunit 3